MPAGACLSVEAYGKLPMFTGNRVYQLDIISKSGVNHKPELIENKICCKDAILFNRANLWLHTQTQMQYKKGMTYKQKILRFENSLVQNLIYVSHIM